MDRLGANGYYCPMHPEVRQTAIGNCPICGMGLVPDVRSEAFEQEKCSRTLKARLIWGIVLSIPIVVVHYFSLFLPPLYNSWIELFFAGCVIGGPGLILFKQGWGTLNLSKGHFYALASLGILISYLFSVLKVVAATLADVEWGQSYLSGYYFEPAVWITNLVLAGLYAQAIIEEKILEQIEILKRQIPLTAHLVMERGEERKIAIDDVKRGDLLRVKPNERVPADGVITEGQSWMNESMLTGETLPVYKRSRDRVLAGSINGNSSFVFLVERMNEDTLLAKLIQVITRARKTRASIQDSIDRFLAFFVPGVILLAIVSCLFWYMQGEPLSIAVGRFVSVIIAASPNAFAVAVPMAMVVSFGIAARHGILIREAQSLQSMQAVNTLVVDKTGVLTEGKPLLTKIHALFPFSDAEVLRWGASVESSCDHPVALAVVSGAHLKQVALQKASHVQALEGKGVVARIDGSRVVVGNRQLLDDLGIDYHQLLEEAEAWQKEGLTVSYVVMEDRAAGLIAVADPLRYASERTVQQLHQEGLSVVMATGDSKEAALAVGKRLHIDTIEAAMLTQDKMALVQKLQGEGLIVAMAGDGVIDAPALAQADVGISLNSSMEAGSQGAGILILKGDLRGVVRVRHLSKKVMSVIKQTLAVLGIYNVIMISLAAGLTQGFLPVSISPLTAAVMLSLANLFAVGNALRLRKVMLYQD